jgi:hypothetical protein
MNWKDFITELVENSTSARWLAEQIGCDESAVSKWKAGKSVPKGCYWSDLISLSHAAGMKHVDVKYLGGLL